MHKPALAILLCAVGCKSSTAPPAPLRSAAGLPIYTVHRAASAVTIDGLLDEPAWQGADKVALARSTDGRPATWATEARLLWDDERLYVGFKCDDRNVSTPFTQDDQPLYTSNVVEIFLNPKGDLARYFEVEVAPSNALFDASFTGRRQGMDLGWASGARHAVHVDGTLNDPRDQDRGWSAELAIPFAALDGARPGRGTEWRFNLYRLLQGQGQPNEGQAYNPPLVGDFHAVDKFAILKFDN